jgi:hypothetical protein
LIVLLRDSKLQIEDPLELMSLPKNEEVEEVFIVEADPTSNYLEVVIDFEEISYMSFIETILSEILSISKTGKKF